MKKYILIFLIFLFSVNVASATIQAIIYPNSTQATNYSSGFSRLLAGENLYSANLPFAAMTGTNTVISAQNLTMLSNISATRTGWHNFTGSTTLDETVVVNFTQKNVALINWLNVSVLAQINKTPTGTQAADSLNFGIRNFSASGSGYNLTNWSKNSTNGTWQPFTFNITGTNISNFVRMIGQTANWSVALWSNGGNLSWLVIDQFNTTISYEPFPFMNITTHQNNQTNNNTLTLAVNQNTPIMFNGTTNDIIDSNSTTNSSGVNRTSSNYNYTSGTVFFLNYTMFAYGSQYVNFSVTNSSSGTSDYRNWSVTVVDNVPPNQITGFTNSTLPVNNAVNLQWNAPQDNAGGSGINRTFIDKTNDSIYFSSNPVFSSPTINASRIRSGTTTNWTTGKYQDAYYYTMRNNAPNVSCVGCHTSPVDPQDYNMSRSPVFMKFNSTHLLVFAHFADNDTNNSDDYFAVGIDPDASGGTKPGLSDRLYEIHENGTLSTFSGTGTDWGWNSTLKNISAVSGSGGNAPRYEMAINLSEIGNPTNLSAVRVVFEADCLNGSDFIQRSQYYPEYANDEDPSNWTTLIYRNTTQWDNFSVSSSPTATTITLSGLTSNYRYNLSAYARDNSTNNGTRSSSLIIRTSDRPSWNIYGYVNVSTGGKLINGASVELIDGIEYIELTNSTGAYIMSDIVSKSYQIYAFIGLNHISETKWANITSANLTNVNLTLNNSAVNISIPATNSVYLGNTIILNPIATDPNFDTIVWDSNETDSRVTLSTTTGQFTLVSNGSDLGTYNYYINASDGFGSINRTNFSITVNPQPTFVPPTPLLDVVDGGFDYVYQSWTAGAGNITDSFNYSVNGGAWTNGTLNLNVNTTGLPPGGWANLTVYAWNNSGVGTLNTTALINNTKVTAQEQGGAPPTSVYPIIFGYILD